MNSEYQTPHPDPLSFVLLSAVIFIQIHFFVKNSFRNSIKVSNSFDPVQTRHFFEPDLGPNCLQRLSVDDTGRQVGVVFGNVN